MKGKIVKLGKQASSRDYWHKKYFRRFTPEDFRKEMYDHITGGPPTFADWQFKLLARVKADAYADSVIEYERARQAIDKLILDVAEDKKEKLLDVRKQLDKSMQLFIDAALGGTSRTD